MRANPGTAAEFDRLRYAENTALRQLGEEPKPRRVAVRSLWLQSSPQA